MNGIRVGNEAVDQHLTLELYRLPIRLHEKIRGGSRDLHISVDAHGISGDGHTDAPAENPIEPPRPHARVMGEGGNVESLSGRSRADPAHSYSSSISALQVFFSISNCMRISPLSLWFVPSPMMDPYEVSSISL